MAIRVLIVDDSAFMRKIIRDILEEIDDVEVIGIARNGEDALEKIPGLNPDIITLDIEMPKLNGIETLKMIKEEYNIPVVMLSSVTSQDRTIEALDLGAYDFIRKPSDLNSNLDDLRSELENPIECISKLKKTPKNPPKPKKSKETRAPKNDKNQVKAVAIGASTGGPKVLLYLISNLPKRIKTPIFIVQHMPKGFTTSLANRMDKESKVKVVEAEDGMIIEDNTVYLAPGDYHMVLNRNKITLNQNEKIHGVRPAVDYMFDSASKIYKDKLLGIILTGMGKDGADGMDTIKNNGGYNIAQSEESCVVYGMPGSAVAKGVVDEILDIEDISKKVNELVGVD